MSELITVTSVVKPEDREICNLSISLSDLGVEVKAQSPILAEFVKSKSIAIVKGEDYYLTMKGLMLHKIPARYGPDFLSHITNELFDERGNPNMLWLRCEGLAEGISITFAQPVHVPADLIEYLSRAMEKAGMIYGKYVRKACYKSTLIERK